MSDVKETAASCPRCGAADPGAIECRRCGVVLAKVRDRAERRAPPAMAAAEAGRRRFDRLDLALLAALAAAGALWFRSSGPRPDHRPAAPPKASAPAVQQGSGTTRAGPEHAVPHSTGTDTGPSEEPPPERPPADPVPPPFPGPAAGAVQTRWPPSDAAEIARLEASLQRAAPIADADVYAAEDLAAKHPQDPEVRRTVERLLLTAARQAAERGRTLDAARLYARATELLPDAPRAWSALVLLHQRARDWRQAEQVARRALSALPEDASLHRALATALMRQDRSDEAVEVLRRLLARKEDAVARSLLAQLEQELGATGSMARTSSSHFRLRFEGDENGALGQAVLRVLEEKYALLARTLDGEPAAEIPVILYPTRAFQEVALSTGAPFWAGATYSHFDGRIRIGTRDLSAGFVPLDLERTLTHELTHAFVDAIARGSVPGPINEGLAQYLSGKRLGYRLARSRALPGPGGRMKVQDYYDSALSFVEHLVERHRQSSLNDVLRSIGDTRDVDQAFRRVYRESYAGMREEWLAQLE